MFEMILPPGGRLFSMVLAAFLVSWILADPLPAQEVAQEAVPENMQESAEEGLGSGFLSEAVEVSQHSANLIFGNEEEFDQALVFMRDRGKADVIPSLILAVRYRYDREEALNKVMTELTGHNAEGWFEWMLWQEAHPELRPHPSYVGIKTRVLLALDEEFIRFVNPEISQPEQMDIRLEEVTWGGVAVDGIPSLDNPDLIEAAEADYMFDSDLVFGVEINGDARAYPLRIMGWHEMFNETIGGVPVALAYCTLCGAGILFETEVEGFDAPLVFGSSGLLYRSNKLMFDRTTNSLWNQFTGEPVSGYLRKSGIKLKVRPVAITSWKAWKEVHPDTKVLSIDTGFIRDYGSGVVYQDYFGSADLMFPTNADEGLLRQKDHVFGIRDVGLSKAWPMDAFRGGKVINDEIGGRSLVLIGDAETHTVRAYERSADQTFTATDKEAHLDGHGGIWTISETEIRGPNGESLPRLPGHVAYWFAWNGYFGGDSELYAAVTE
ncbi:MAG: DUF3179 domain-containing protein [Pseudomonadota bacterium]